MVENRLYNMADVVKNCVGDNYSKTLSKRTDSVRRSLIDVSLLLNVYSSFKCVNLVLN